MLRKYEVRTTGGTKVGVIVVMAVVLRMTGAKVGVRRWAMVAITLEAVLEQARQLQPDEQEQLLAILEDERIARLEKLFTEWRNDTSGYDEEAWPELQAALDRTRAELGMRTLFDE